MAFITIEDLYGQIEVIAFENCYQASYNLLLNDEIVLIEGRLSIREDEETKIIANRITKFGQKSSKSLTIDITDLEEEKKAQLRGAIKFFSGDKNNISINIKEKEEEKACGGIYITENILKEFEELIGKQRVKLNE